MARAQSTDFLHAMRFHVTVGNGTVHLPSSTAGTTGGPTTGFSACTTPSATQEVATYREGHYIYTRKQPGLPTMDDVTLSRGVTFTDSDFWLWLQDCIEGKGEYREDVTINHYHREALPQGQAVSGQPANNSSEVLNLSTGPSRVYHLFNAFPTTHKVSGDLDASASEISIMTLGLSYESFQITSSNGPLV